MSEQDLEGDPHRRSCGWIPEDVRHITLSIAEIVDGVLLHAQSMLEDETYGWPKTRAALERILADLETQSAGDPGIERMRRLMATGEEVWKMRQEREHWLRLRPRFGAIGFARGAVGK